MNRKLILLLLVICVLFMMSKTELYSGTTSLNDDGIDLTDYERLENVKVSNNVMQQIILAVKFILGPYSWVIAIPILWIGLISGTVIGLFSEYFRQYSLWFKQALIEEKNNV